MTEPTIWLCRVIGGLLAFAGLYGLVAFWPAIFNFEDRD